MRDLSVIIPARNEMFLTQTVMNVLENIEADTEVIVICDGNWPDPPIPDNGRVIVVHHTIPIGQRAATNEGAKISQARFIMKLDAHCAVDKGFDRKLIEYCQPDWTMIPAMWNLHAFDWECRECHNRTYQGIKPSKCEKCGAGLFDMKIVWEPRHKRQTVSWRFDRNMQFQYWKSHAKRPECQGNIIETMSCIGACFMMPRDRFWELGGMDEAHGSWGQFGTELACKAWLSGGKMVTNKLTWFAHMFRTGNFNGAFEGNTFPYWLDDAQVQHARAYSRDLWLNDKWPKAVRPLSWLVEHFKPVPDWHDE